MNQKFVDLSQDESVNDVKPGDWLFRKWSPEYGDEWDIGVYVRKGYSSSGSRETLIVKNFIRLEDTTLKIIETNCIDDIDWNYEHPDNRLALQTRLMTPEEYEFFEPAIKRAITKTTSKKFGL